MEKTFTERLFDIRLEIITVIKDIVRTHGFTSDNKVFSLDCGGLTLNGYLHKINFIDYFVEDDSLSIDNGNGEIDYLSNLSLEQLADLTDIIVEVNS